MLQALKNKIKDNMNKEFSKLYNLTEKAIENEKGERKQLCLDLKKDLSILHAVYLDRIDEASDIINLFAVIHQFRTEVTSLVDVYLTKLNNLGCAK